MHSLTKRADDEDLAARALSMNEEEKRAVLLLEGAGLIGSSLEGDVAAGDTDHSKYDACGDSQNSRDTYRSLSLSAYRIGHIGGSMFIQNG